MVRMRRLPPLPTVSELVRLYKLRALKNLSQNFLLDMNLCHKFVRNAGRLEGCHTCEVGPGPGGITRALLERNVDSLSVVELDRRFIPGLEILAECSDKRLHVHQGDALNYDFSHFFPPDTAVPWTSGIPKLHILGNLPFSVSTPLIIKWLKAISEHTGAWSYGRTPLTLTFQKEVAERMVAGVAEDQRSRLSIMTQYLCNAQLKFIIPGSAFVPPPKVDVGVVKLVPLKEPKINLPFGIVEKIVRYVFQYRQKRCFRGIETLFPPGSNDLVNQMFERSSVSPDQLPTKLSIEDFGRLCQAYVDICHDNPDVNDFDFRARHGAKAWRNRKKGLHLNQRLQRQPDDNIDIQIAPSGVS